MIRSSQFTQHKYLLMISELDTNIVTYKSFCVKVGSPYMFDLYWRYDYEFYVQNIEYFLETFHF